MARDGINIRVKADPETNVELEKWAKDEDRSKRRHASVLLRKLVKIRREKPDALRALGLAS